MASETLLAVCCEALNFFLPVHCTVHICKPTFNLDKFLSHLANVIRFPTHKNGLPSLSMTLNTKHKKLYDEGQPTLFAL